MYATIAWENTYIGAYEWDKDISFLILHGRGGSSRSWTQVAKLLNQRGYTVYVPDVPWFGRSSMTKVYTIQEYAVWVEACIDKLWLQRYIIIWHSNGGRISIKYLSTHNTSVEKVFLVNAAAFVHSPTRKKRIIHMLAKIWKKLLAIPGMSIIRKYAYKVIWWHDYLALDDTNTYKKETFLHMIATDLSEDLSHMHIPTHLIRWAKDTYTPLSDGKNMHELVTWSTLDVFENEKHGIHLTIPDQLVKKILSYL